MKKLRIVTLGISGGGWLTGPFRDARRFPSTRWYLVPEATRTPLGLGSCPSFKDHSLSRRAKPGTRLRFATFSSLYTVGHSWWRCECAREGYPSRENTHHASHARRCTPWDTRGGAASVHERDTPHERIRTTRPTLIAVHRGTLVVALRVCTREYAPRVPRGSTATKAHAAGHVAQKRTLLCRGEAGLALPPAAWVSSHAHQPGSKI
jgi:hypothetical protein